MGPGAHDPNFGFVKRRTDVLGAKYAPLTEYNDREHIANLANKNATDFDLNPIFDFIKKKAPSFKISKKLDLEGPKNLPEKFLYPERWQHYDISTKLTKNNTELGPKFTDKNFKKYKLYKEEKDFLSAYLNLQHKIPDPGFYEPLFDLIEAGVQAPDFGRYLERSRMLTKEEIMNKETDGDMLILQPEKLRPKVQDLRMERITGRKDKKINELEERLVLEKNYAQIDKNVPNVKFVKEKIIFRKEWAIEKQLRGFLMIKWTS